MTDRYTSIRTKALELALRYSRDADQASETDAYDTKRENARCARELAEVASAFDPWNVLNSILKYWSENQPYRERDLAPLVLSALATLKESAK